MRDLLAIKVGDVLPVDIPRTIHAGVDGVTVLECHYGVLNGQYALRVERVIQPEPDTHGANHA